MAMAHRQLPRWGVQFHPESILTPDGPAMFANFFHLVK
jgi:anthranilate/para-aminobenzoate synthase component II